MKNILLVSGSICLLLFFSSCACVPLKKYHDKRVSRFINRNLQSVYALGDSVRAAATGDKKYPGERTLKDFHVKKSMKKLGDGTTVYFDKKYYPLTDSIEPCDSVVIFERMSILLGIREIIYDFSENQKTYRDNPGYRNYYSFRQAAPKIYIRRRQIPMM